MTDRESRNAKAAATLREAHRPGDPLLLPNVWDAASARTIQEAGFPAVATASAAVSPALGHADGEDTPPQEMFDAVARIVRAVDVPVTADLEHGYGLTAAELVARVLASGAAGCNIEDSDPRTGELVDAGRQAAYLGAIRAAADEAGADLVLNARVDTYLHGPGEPERRLAETLSRIRAYRAAGADCVYPIFLADPEEIATLVGEAGCPVNILFRPGTPPLRRLAELGVARISFGPGVHKATQRHLAHLAAEIRAGRDPYGPAA